MIPVQDGEREAETLTYGDCLAWAKRYASTPWNMLALSTTIDKQPSALRVMQALFDEVARLVVERDAAERALEAIDEVTGPYDDGYVKEVKAILAAVLRGDVRRAPRRTPL